jgi:lambda family phage portal protein
MSFLEKSIKYISPTWALKREQAKTQIAALRSYDAAGRGRRLATWNPVDTSAQTESIGVLALLRARSRDLVRNNGWVKRGCNGVVANAIGSGIVPTVIGGTPKQADAIRALWRNWADSTACSIDGRKTFSGIQTLAMKAIVESGEVLIRRVRTKDPRVPIRLQVLECDYLDCSRDDLVLKNGARVIQGIEIDSNGKRIAYHLFKDHPGNYSTISRESVRVSADDICHIFREDRAGQVRGIPWTAAAVVTSRDLDDFESAELLRRKIAACFAAFVVDAEGVDSAQGDEISERIEPGAIEVLPPGKDIRFGSPPAVPYYSEYINSMLRKVAAGLDVPFEVLTGDYSQVNFSSGRMGWIEFQRSLDQWRWEMIVPLLCMPVWEWFAQAVTLANGINFEGVSAQWTAPRREMIDPTKEIEATKNAIRSGLTTLPEAQRAMGFDPELVMAEYALTNKKIDSLGLVFDSDPRKTAGNGAGSVINGNQNADPKTAG